MTITTTPSSAVKLDAVLIPGAWRDEASVLKQADQPLIASLRALNPSIAVWSYCTGVCLVAEAGRLEGQAATTTWWLHDWVVDHYPDVQWRMNDTLVFQENTATASGVTGYLPLALELVKRHCGAATVDAIRDHLLLPRPVARHTPFQTLPTLMQKSAFIRSVVSWVESTPAAELSAVGLAEAMNTTPRTLNRRLHKETQMQPGQLMRVVKLKQVADRLVGSRHSIQQIAEELGYSDDASLRRSFKQMTGLTPKEYRAG